MTVASVPLRVAELSMQVGAYLRFDVDPPCGLASNAGVIGNLDDPLSFYHPDHDRAGLLWFRCGFVEYAFPNPLPTGARPASLELSFEACSDAPNYDENLLSDITLWINDREVGTWTSPGDFGGRQGRYTPEWWSPRDTQFGLLKHWRVDGEGSFLDGERVSGTKIGDLAIPGQCFLIVGLGVKPDAVHVGGMNLFGSSFGDYPQDPQLRLAYSV
jgi:predicted transcriptional regulator